MTSPKTDTPLPSALNPLATADLADLAPRPIAMTERIRPLWRGARFVGPAATVRTPPGEHQAVRHGLERAGRGAVLVVDGGGDLRRALWGENMSRLAMDRGLAGVVIDGAARDVDGIEALRFPVFAAGRVPTPPQEDSPGEVDVPVFCGNVEVHPGDFVYGDEDGVVVVDPGLHEEILRRLAK